MFGVSGQAFSNMSEMHGPSSCVSTIASSSLHQSSLAPSSIVAASNPPLHQLSPPLHLSGPTVTRLRHRHLSLLIVFKEFTFPLNFHQTPVVVDSTSHVRLTSLFNEHRFSFYFILCASKTHLLSCYGRVRPRPRSRHPSLSSSFGFPAITNIPSWSIRQFHVNLCATNSSFIFGPSTYCVQNFPS